jgi:hypothetical protein
MQNTSNEDFRALLPSKNRGGWRRVSAARTYNQACLCYLHHIKMSDGKADNTKVNGDKYQPNTQGKKVSMLVAHFKNKNIHHGLEDFKGGEYFYVFLILFLIFLNTILPFRFLFIINSQRFPSQSKVAFYRICSCTS